MAESAYGVTSSTLICVRLFGPMEVTRRGLDGGWQTIRREEWSRGTPPRSILKRLLTAPGRRLSRADIQDDLWSETDGDLADRNLSDGLMVIRRIIGKELIETVGPLCSLADQTQIWTDIDACRSLLRRAENQGGATQEALPFLEEAFHYFERGECLQDEGETWCHGVRADVVRMRRQCSLWLASAYESIGKLWQAGEVYQSMMLVLPPDEEALADWMQMLVRHGKQRDALQCYRDTKKFVEVREYTLSSALDTLATRLEEQEALHIVDSFVLPETSMSLWRPDPAHPEVATRFTAWGALLQPTREVEAYQEIACDVLEVEIIAMALRWKWSSGSISLLQSLISEAIRKHDIMHTDPSNDDTRITRRRALRTIALLPIQMYGLGLAAKMQQHLPLDELLSCCASGITACWELRQYEPEGLAEISRILPAYLPILEKLARQSSPFQQDAARLAAQGYLLVTVLAEHFRRLDQMEAASSLARLYGQVAHDSDLEAVALIRLAVKFGFERRIVEAFNTYQEALALPGFSAVSPLVQGRVYAGLAGSGAFCQQHSAALSFLSRAKEVYPVEPESDPSFSFAINGSSALPFWEGLTLRRVGQHAEAIEAFSLFGSLTPVPGVPDTYRSEHLNYAASVAVEQRELDTACALLSAAEEVAQNIHHKQRQVEVRETFHDLQLLWQKEPRVKALQEKLYA